jgi:transposase InsO family protein
MSDDKIPITKLATDGANWISYRDRMVWAFDNKRWAEHLTTDTVPAAWVTIGALTPQQRWDTEESSAKIFIAASVPDHVFNRIKAKPNVKSIWDAIKEIYQKRSKMITVDLGRKLQGTKLGDDEDARLHFTHLSDMKEQLASMGKTIDDDEFASILLGSLPPSYESTVNAINAAADQADVSVSPDRVIRLVTDDYDRRVIKKGKSKNGPEEAFAANGQKKERRNIECHNCHRIGHYKSECWAKGGDKEGQYPPRREGNTSNDNRNRGNHSDTNNGNNRNGQNRNNNRSNNRNDKANSASADIEAWAAIEEIEDYDPSDYSSTDHHPITPHIAYSAGQVSTQPQVEVELYDSGASRHMSPFRHRFTNYRTIPPRPITAANKRVFYAIGTGDLQIDVPNGNVTTPVLLKDTLHAPDMALTIVSIGRITGTGSSVTFEDNTCKIKTRTGKIIGKIPASTNGLYKVEHAHSVYNANNDTVEQVDIHTLHRRLGHISADAIRTLIRNNAIEGIHLIDDGSPIICDSCEYAKMTRKAIRSERVAPPAQYFGAEIHTDLWGPSPVRSLGGRRYYVTFTDDFSRFTWVHTLRSKDETLQSYRAFANWALTQYNVKIKILRSDRGGEYTGREFTKFLQEQGTERRLTTHDTPQHNGVAESLNRRLLERVRAILHHSDLPKNLWAEALHFAVWLKNRTSTKTLGNKTTPFEKLHGDKPNLSGVPEWGQTIWVHFGSGSKLDARGIEARWVGYDSESTHAHRVYWPYKNSVTVERNVKFATPFVTIRSGASGVIMPLPIHGPAAPPVPPAPPAGALPPAQAVSGPSQIPRATALSRTTLAPSSLPPLTPSPHPSHPPATGESDDEQELEDEEEFRTPTTTPAPPRPPKAKGRAQPPPEPTRKSARVPKPSRKAALLQSGDATAGSELTEEDEPLTLRGAGRREIHSDFQPPGAFTSDSNHNDFAYLAESEELMEAALTETPGDPKTLAQARSRSDWPQWQQAMDREIKALEDAGTWITVPRPPGKNIVSSKWVFRIKRKADGTIEKHKARLVARGFTQRYGVDYFDTFSPVARLASFRTILALAARNDWDIDTFDFNGAYLNGELSSNEDIFMQEPPGYTTEGEHVKHLKKSLYGLKQAGRKWYDTLCRALTDLGFRVNDADPGVFSARNNEHTTILAVHVDDCLITGSSPSIISDYKRKLHSRYSLTDLGPIHWLLGIKITRDRNAHTISLSQTTYIDTILSKFSLSEAKPVPTPIVPGATFSKADAPSDATSAAHMSKTPYREAVGSLMYAAVATRPDITFAISTLSQFLDNPGELHWEAVKRVFRYLAGTKTHSLTYGNEHHDLLGYTDADGASQEHRHAISGFAFLIDGAAVSWTSKKQELVTLSTAESEYVAATHAAKECIWLRRLIKPLFGPALTPTTLHCDNQAALHLATEDNYHARTKHIDIRFHFIRQTISDKQIDIKYCPTEDMTADILTKALPKFKVAFHSQTLGIRRA